MVRCRQAQHISKQPVKIKVKAAIQWLIENPKENPVAAARLHFIDKPNSFYKACSRAKKKLDEGEDPFTKKLTNYGQTRILTLVQHAAVINYATYQAVNGGNGATRQMLYNAIVFLRARDRKPPLT
jgi:hypothetical protein